MPASRRICLCALSGEKIRIMPSFTRDSISLRGAGIVTITQPAHGHRFTLDSILLADFCRIKPRDRILELGAGTGIIALLLAKKFPKSLFHLVEVQQNLQTLCTRNILDNGLQERVSAIKADLRGLDRAVKQESFDVIVANPPYTGPGAGRSSPLAARRTARQEREARLEQWLDRQALLKNRGRYFLVFAAARAAELITLLRERSLEPKRMRLVHPYEDKPASLVLLEAVKNAAPGTCVLPPLVVHEPGGGYAEEMRAIYGLGAARQ